MSSNGNAAKQFSRLVKKYRQDYISVSIYLNVMGDGQRFYDTVIHRKIKSSNEPDGFEWRRGTNLKPRDLPILASLLHQAHEFLSAELNTERDSPL